MQEGPNSKQQIVDKIKQSTNILVTVGANPSVDALASALGLTLMLIKLDKHATAVFSGVVPPAISFLEPNKTFENNVDSLRDFIIALDKEKADRLRYKVEDDVVRIFITPYRTRITEKDLQFSQGDFNVDLIIALGVEDQKDLDQAITAHGRILHDATVVTINAGSQKSSLGSIDWQDNNASSLSEMLAGMAEALKPGILDQQISTAMLTGIVSSTERFSNQRTTPRVMTISAQLMAAGANQQLIATKLQTIPAPVSPRKEKPRQDNRQQGKNQGANGGEAPANGEMQIEHEVPAPAPTPSQPPKQQPQQKPRPKVQPVQPEPTELELPIAPPAAQTFNDLKEALHQETVKNIKPEREMVAEPPTPGSQNINEPEAETAQPPSSKDGYLTTHPSWLGRDIQPPSMGGSLSATAEQALEDKQRSEQEEKRNRTILTHGAVEQEAVSELSPEPTPESQSAPEPVIEPVSEPVIEPPVEQQPAPSVEASPVVPEPVPVQPIEQPATTPPATEPVSAASEMPVEVPVAPPPLVVSEPVITPAPEPSIAPAQPAAEVQPAPPIEAQPTVQPAPVPEPVQTGPTLEELEREAASHAIQSTVPQTLGELEAARDQAIPAQPATMPAQLPVQPGGAPLELPPLPPMPDFGTLPPMPGTEVAPAVAPMPEPVLPQLPQDTLTPQPPVEPPRQQTPPPVSNDPTQFRIPTQP